jgi:hypothetical protein
VNQRSTCLDARQSGCLPDERFIEHDVGPHTHERTHTCVYGKLSNRRTSQAAAEDGWPVTRVDELGPQLNGRATSCDERGLIHGELDRGGMLRRDTEIATRRTSSGFALASCSSDLPSALIRHSSIPHHMGRGVL